MKNLNPLTDSFSFFFHPAASKIFLAIIFGLSITVYSYFKVADLLSGPRIIVIAPANGADLKEPLVELKGKATRIALLSLNGGKIFTDENGDFKEKLLLAEGHNIIRMEATDKFGRKTEKILSLVYNL